MVSRAKSKRNALKSSFNFGGLDAENDHLLSTSYYDNGDFETIASMDERRCFVVGRTGSGKTAAFKRLTEQHPDKVITIAPESLSMPYIMNLGAVQYLLDLDVHLEPFLTALWKHVIIVEVIKHRYHVVSPDAKRTAIQEIREKFSKDRAKLKALDYLEQFGESFWCETDERVKEIAANLEKRIETAAGLGTLAGIGGGGLKYSSSETESTETRKELQHRFQQIVNETQLARLNEMLNILNEDTLRSRQNFTYIVIDDLDKDWVDERLANLLIKCLFQAVIDMLKIENLKILVAIRTNIFRQLDFGARSWGSQEEKFRNKVIEINWTKNDLLALMDQRVTAASEFYGIAPAWTLSTLLPNHAKSRPAPADYVINRTLMRPRDAILFLNRCVRSATGKSRATWADIYDAEIEYSEDRLIALRDEWKNPYPGIDRFLEGFRGSVSLLNRNQLTSLIDDRVVELLSDSTFPGIKWLTEIAQPIWTTGGAEGDWQRMYCKVVTLLFNFGFLGISVGQEKDRTYVYSSRSYPKEELVANGSVFEVHRAFWKALHIRELIVGTVANSSNDAELLLRTGLKAA